MYKSGLQTTKSEFTPLTASSLGPSLTIDRQNVVIGGGGVSVIANQSGPRYSADIGHVKVQSSSLSADEMKLFAAMGKRRGVL
jgi:hypothetical protein